MVMSVPCPPNTNCNFGPQQIFHGNGAPTDPANKFTPPVPALAAVWIDDTTGATYAWIVPLQAWK